MKPQQTKKNKPAYWAVAKYSNIAVRMVVIIGGSIAAGVYADKYFELSFPVLTLLASFGSVCLAIYVTIKDLIK